MSKYGIFHDLVRDFNEAAKLTEDQIPGLHRTDVFSRKAVSHFTLGTALELMLKLMLRNRGVPFGRTHSLVTLYDVLPGDFKKEFQRPEGRYFMEDTFAFQAFTESAEEPPPISLDDDIGSQDAFRGLLAYLDRHARVSQKRYVWESMKPGEWQYYLTDIGPIARTIDRVLADYRHQMDRMMADQGNIKGIAEHEQQAPG